MLTPDITAIQLFLHERTAALFEVLFFSAGDRAQNLTLVKTQEIM